MKTIVFKSEKKAKVYRVFSSKIQGCYGKDELLRIVKTDDIDKLLADSNLESYAVEQK